MKEKLEKAIETIWEHCKSNHYCCSKCAMHNNDGCGIAKEPRKWKVKRDGHWKTDLGYVGA